MRLKLKKLTISKKIILLYSVILFSTLIILTSVFYFSIEYYSKKTIEGDLNVNAATIINCINNSKHFDQTTFNNLLLGPGISFNILDEAGNLLYASAPAMPQPDFSEENDLSGYEDKETGAEFAYINLSYNTMEKLYYIQVLKNVNYYKEYDEIFKKSFVFECILGIIICLVSGYYISRSVLKPIRNMSNIAKEITSQSLDRRMPADGPADELKDLSNIFNSMVERLESDFERQKRFASDVSHELRTPLSIILGNISMLKRWGKNDPEVLTSSLETLQSETENMNKLVDNLLFLSMCDNNIALKKESFNLSLLLQEVTDEVLLIHTDHSVSYVCDKDIVICADFNAIKQVLRNLINNSIKYSPPPGNIVIKGEMENECTSITVSDKGIGIPAENLPFIFDRFYRVDESRNRVTGGHGLGLSIVKNIILSHNGTITADSKPGEGTKILLPL